MLKSKNWRKNYEEIIDKGSAWIEKFNGKNDNEKRRILGRYQKGIKKNFSMVHREDNAAKVKEQRSKKKLNKKKEKIVEEGLRKKRKTARKDKWKQNRARKNYEEIMDEESTWAERVTMEEEESGKNIFEKDDF